jgi:hypothetical protein
MASGDELSHHVGMDRQGASSRGREGRGKARPDAGGNRRWWSVSAPSPVYVVFLCAGELSGIGYW